MNNQYNIQEIFNTTLHKGSVYFIGIGGIGMSALAKYFHSIGMKVSGYDKTETDITKSLKELGINICFDESIHHIPNKVDLVIYTPAIPKEQLQLKFCIENNLPLFKRSDVLEAITKNKTTIAIAGTHGKTTISTMIACILEHSGFGCTAFLGGISSNYNTNFWSSSNKVYVVEADEYDRSFLKLHPTFAAISAMDADHLDIYGTQQNMENAFVAFAKQVNANGILLYKFGLKRSRDLQAQNSFTYSLQNDAADFFAKDITIHNGMYHFSVIGKNFCIENIQLGMGGMHNVENAVVAAAIAHKAGVDDEKIKSAFVAFKGVKRRFEYVIKNHRWIYIDDYAHHPEELKAVINGAKTLYPLLKCNVVFQPHLYSRTKDLAQGFADSLDLADEVMLLPIYPARELPIEGVSSSMIKEKMKNEYSVVCTKEDCINKIKEWSAASYEQQILITAGAGDIDKMVVNIKTLLN